MLRRQHRIAHDAKPLGAVSKLDRLQHRFALLLKAGWTQPMFWLGGLHAWLQNVGKRSRSHFVKRIALSFSRPTFMLHQLFFKLAYAVGQRELSRLGRKCELLGGQNLSLQFADLGIERLHDLVRDVRRGRRSAGEVEQALGEIHRRLEACTDRNKRAGVSHAAIHRR